MSETIKCKFCGKSTVMQGTKQCDRCWEITHRLSDLIKGDPEIASKILSFCMDEALELMEA
jgi:hypothetical protein